VDILAANIYAISRVKCKHFCWVFMYFTIKCCYFSVILFWSW